MNFGSGAMENIDDHQVATYIPSSLSGLINEKLPIEVLALVFDRMSLKDLRRANLICKYWYIAQPIALNRRESLRLLLSSHQEAAWLQDIYPDNLVCCNLTENLCERLTTTFVALKRLEITFWNGLTDELIEQIINGLFKCFARLASLSISFGDLIRNRDFMQYNPMNEAIEVDLGDDFAQLRIRVEHHHLLARVLNVNDVQAGQRIDRLLQAIDGLPSLRSLELDITPVSGKHQKLFRRLHRFVYFEKIYNARRVRLSFTRNDSTQAIRIVKNYGGDNEYQIHKIIEHYFGVVHQSLTNVSVLMTAPQQSVIWLLKTITIASPCLIQTMSLHFTNISILHKEDDLPTTEVPVRPSIKTLTLCFDFDVTSHKALNFAYIGWIFSGVKHLTIKYRLTGCAVARCGYTNAREEKEFTRLDCVRALLKPFKKWQAVLKIRTISLDDGFACEESKNQDKIWVLGDYGNV